MKKAITKLEDALALELQSLYDGEMSLKEKIEEANRDTDCIELKEILKKYAESSDHKRLKLDRMFSYLMVEPSSQGSTIIGKLLDETVQRAKHTLSDKIKTPILISGFQQVNHFKIASYKTALQYALEVDLDTVADLLQQVIEWERKTEKALADLCVKEFNKCSVADPSICKK